MTSQSFVQRPSQTTDAYNSGCGAPRPPLVSTCLQSRLCRARTPPSQNSPCRLSPLRPTSPLFWIVRLPSLPGSLHMSAKLFVHWNVRDEFKLLPHDMFAMTFNYYFLSMSVKTIVYSSHGHVRNDFKLKFFLHTSETTLNYYSTGSSAGTLSVTDTITSHFFLRLFLALTLTSFYRFVAFLHFHNDGKLQPLTLPMARYRLATGLSAYLTHIVQTRLRHGSLSISGPHRLYCLDRSCQAPKMLKNYPRPTPDTDFNSQQNNPSLIWTTPSSFLFNQHIHRSALQKPSTSAIMHSAFASLTLTFFTSSRLPKPSVSCS